MTPKQQLRSLEKKMQRLNDSELELDLEDAVRYFHNIEKYYKLSREHFWLKFEIEHCSQCGKRL